VIHGMSNGGINCWDKVERGKVLFQRMVDEAERDYPKWI